MNGTSYLLAIDGSKESRSAAYFAWELAKQTGARVVAQHVIDTATVWRLLAYDLPGFIGSGVYLDAKEKIAEVLYSIADSLMLSYGTQIAGQALKFENIIDEGERVAEIARRAKEHDLVVVGYHCRGVGVRRPRMFEKLADICPCPVLVVQMHCRPFSINQQGNLQDMLAGAKGDKLMVVTHEAAAKKNTAGHRTKIRSFLDDSDDRALLIVPGCESSQITRKLAS